MKYKIHYLKRILWFSRLDENRWSFKTSTKVSQSRFHATDNNPWKDKSIIGQKGKFSLSLWKPLTF